MTTVPVPPVEPGRLLTAGRGGPSLRARRPLTAGQAAPHCMAAMGWRGGYFP